MQSIVLPAHVVTEYRRMKAGDMIQFELPTEMAHLSNLDIANALEAADPPHRRPHVQKYGRKHHVTKL